MPSPRQGQRTRSPPVLLGRSTRLSISHWQWPASAFTQTKPRFSTACWTISAGANSVRQQPKPAGSDVAESRRAGAWVPGPRGPAALPIPARRHGNAGTKSRPGPGFESFPGPESSAGKGVPWLATPEKGERTAGEAWQRATRDTPRAAELARFSESKESGTHARETLRPVRIGKTVPQIQVARPTSPMIDKDCRICRPYRVVDGWQAVGEVKALQRRAWGLPKQGRDGVDRTHPCGQGNRP